MITNKKVYIVIISKRFMESESSREKFDCRIYRWSNTGQTPPEHARAFLIRTSRYGTNLEAYLILVDEARKHFPEISDESIEIGKVKNSGFFDHHPVISFKIQSDNPVPETFRDYGNATPDFGY